ncbi:hypothetical protein ACI2J4_15385 [Agrobacterium tumefaciens]|uniref:hypothetical protein n=1 Tax=Agrobacterium tumefaciens TaxID=358 RepID=UPI00384ED7FF
MRGTLRASKLLALLFRLVMILSLAGYSVSTVNAAMHGPDGVGMRHDQSGMMNHGKLMDHAGSEMKKASHDHQNMADTDGDVKKTEKPQCCGDFCLGMAVLLSHSAIGTRVASTIRTFPDDDKALGQTPLLQRPPNI